MGEVFFKICLKVGGERWGAGKLEVGRGGVRP